MTRQMSSFKFKKPGRARKCTYPNARKAVKKVKAALIAMPLIYLGPWFVGKVFVPRRGF